MRTLIGAVAASMMMTGLAMAEGEMSGAFGNTVTITNAAGAVTKLHINEDNSYKAVLPDGAVHTGTWAMTGEQVCFTQTEPAPAADAAPACGLAQPDKKVGDSWEQGEGDQKVTIAIVEGR